MVAARVLAGPASTPQPLTLTTSSRDRAQRACTACEEEKRSKGPFVARKPSAEEHADPAASQSRGLEAALASARTSGGHPLSPETREFMEPRFGYSFADIRVHADERSATLSRALSARAFTVGRDVFFGRGEYEPASHGGRQLLAHELAHTVQQAQPGAAARMPLIQRAGDPGQAPPTMSCPIATNSVASMLTVRFDQDSAIIPPSEQLALEAFVASWHGQPEPPQVRIDGHASEDGPEPHNWTLSCERAEAVQRVLMSTTAAGAPGIPSAFVELKAQGETTELGAAHADNRVATISSDTPTPPVPSPTPAPTPPPAPAFRCGPDVTAELTAAVARTRSTFSGWSATEREEHCDALDSLSTGGYAWDVVQLHNNDWIHLMYRPACATAGATPPCGSTVQVDAECSYAGSPNYVIFGVMCELCHGHYVGTGNSSGQARFTEAEMLSWIDFYKGPGVVSSAAGNYADSRRWASAGYRGWPTVASPAGDRPGCDPSCPTPHTGPAFEVAWWRNPGFFSSATRTVI
jgi:outer membrane protein OmpA-like peptidoglycan-associated protein